MSQKRQADADQDQAILVRSLGLGLPSGFKIAGHAHPWPQFVYATEGVLTVTAARPEGNGTWVVPSNRAVWIPGDVEHQLETSGKVRLRTLYLRPDFTPHLADSCCVMGVTPLLRELLLETMARGMLRATIPEDERLARVLVDQLARKPEIALDLIWPNDPRAARVADAVQSDLCLDTSLDALARVGGASVRTLERLFLTETGTTFARWRLRLRLLEALRLLASGQAVTTVASSVGYDSTSAFVAAFKRALGTTPGAYFNRET